MAVDDARPDLRLTETDVHRCARGPACAERDRAETDGGHRYWVGALLAGPGLCGSCARHVSHAIGSLPGDVDELSSAELLAPTWEWHLDDPDMPAAPHTKPGPDTPWRDDVYALVEQIDAETEMWANSVARAAGMDAPTTLELGADGARVDPRTGEWLPETLRRMPRYARVLACCELLKHRLPYLLGLPVTEHPARSRTTRRGDGHDPDATTRFGDDYWTNRDGIQGALLLLRLHRAAECYTHRAPADVLEAPCPTCKRPTLIRLHSGNVVDCRACGERLTDQEYDEHFYGVWTEYGLDKPPPRPEGPIVPPTPPPPGMVRVRPRHLVHEALLLADDNLRVAADWCGCKVLDDRKQAAEDGRPPRFWVRPPGATRIGRPGSWLVHEPSAGRNPDRWVIYTDDEYRAAYSEAG